MELGKLLSPLTLTFGSFRGKVYSAVPEKRAGLLSSRRAHISLLSPAQSQVCQDRCTSSLSLYSHWISESLKVVINQREIIEMNRGNQERVSQKWRNNSVWAVKVGLVNRLNLDSPSFGPSALPSAGRGGHVPWAALLLCKSRQNLRGVGGTIKGVQGKLSETHTTKWRFSASPYCWIMEKTKWPCAPAETLPYPHVLCNAHIIVVDKEQLGPNRWGCCYITCRFTARTDDSHI